MTAAERLQLLCFQLGSRVFALDIMGIREILRNQKFTPVPRTPSHIAGVVNLRGQLIPVVHLRRILLPGDGETLPEDPKLIVVKARGKTAGLLVDQVLDVIPVPVEALAPVPGTVRGDRSVVMAAFRRAGGDDSEVVVLVRLAPLVDQECEFGERGERA